jgi:hypothetical protein
MIEVDTLETPFGRLSIGDEIEYLTTDRQIAKTRVVWLGLAEMCSLIGISATRLGGAITLRRLRKIIR